MFGLGNPLSRLKKRLKKLESIIKISEFQLKNSKHNKLDVIKSYNRAILRSFESARDMFYSEIKHYEQEIHNKNIIPAINATFNALFSNLQKIDNELHTHEAELRSMAEKEPEFVDQWVRNWLEDYKNMMIQLDTLESSVRLLREPEKTEHIIRVAEENLARQYMRQGRILTRPRELKQLASACGYYVIEGDNHTDVRTHEGTKITEIPNHNVININTARNIMKAISIGSFVGRKVA